MDGKRVMAIIRHELRLISRDPFPVAVLVLFPILAMVFLKPAFKFALVADGYQGANGSEQVVPGQAVLNAFFIVSMTSFAFFSEYGWNTWERLRASAASPSEIIIGKALPRLAISLAGFVIIFAVGIPLLDLHSRGPLAAAVPLVVALAICLVMLGVVVTALSRTVQQANAFAMAGLVLFGAIGGALVPINVLPAWARTVAPVTPTYWAMRGFRSVILDGTDVSGVLLPVAVLLAMSAVFAVVSVAKFRFDDTKTSWA
jgi:ABC-2 type transport system permease protein